LEMLPETDHMSSESEANHKHWELNQWPH
jgi:hypothetical protein